MPKVFFCDEWMDRRWKRSLKKRSKAQVKQLEEALVALVHALMDCRHPALDPDLQKWSPVKYHAPKKKRGEWVEYHLGDKKNAARAVVCYYPQTDSIFLVARTAIPDHERLKKVVASFDLHEAEGSAETAQQSDASVDIGSGRVDR